MNRKSLLALIVLATLAVCLFALRGGKAQSSTLRRITTTSEEGLNLNPSISGDGRVVGFESTEDVAAAGGSDHFRAIRANISSDPAAFFQMAGSRSVAPAVSQDGSRIAFASKDDPLGANADGNSEIFLFDGAKLTQVTNTSPGSLANRITNGNFQPSISDDGRFIAFSSNRDLAGQNGDGNLEIFVYDAIAASFTQLTNSSGIVGFSDAKISGDGSTVAYIRDPGASPSTARDLLKQPRVGLGPVTLIAANVQSLAMTYGRAISDDGTRVVYSAETGTNITQVFLADGRSGGSVRQITSLGSRVTEVPLHPTISGDGSRIAFAARRTVSGAGSNSDGGVELYVYDLPTASFSKITNGPSSATADVVSSLNDDGSIVAFNYPRVLSGAVTTSGPENNSEIYALAPPARPSSGALTAVLNDASFGHEPSATKAVAPNSIALAGGTNLANTTTQSQRLADGTFPTNVAGTRATVNGRAAQIFFVSPTQVNFLVPAQTEIGTAEVIVTNSENFPARANVTILRAAPGIFTKTGDGIGEGLILNADTLQEGPFDPTSGNLRLTIFTTGARNAAQTNVSIGGRVVSAEAVLASTNMPGLDEVHVRVPSDLRGAGSVNLSVISDGRESNPVTVNFTGDPSRAILINEVLADPPTGDAGDANHDGVRDGTQDEFVELVNGSPGDTIGVSGWTIKTRATGSTTETTRFTFPSGISVAAGESLVIFGGGIFNPTDPVFGCAQVFKATSASSGLSLTNTGLTILVRDSAGNLITQFSYGGSTGLDGNNSQSLTRSPDITGNFVLHSTAPAANGRRFSPGLRLDGTPLSNCIGHPASVTISPSSTSVNQGQSTQFTAQVFDQFGRTMKGVPITFSSDNTAVATIDSTSTNASTGVVTANVGTHNPGVARITASATDGTTTANSTPASLTVVGPSLNVSDVTMNEGNSGTTTFTFTVSLSLPAPAGGVKFDIATQDGTATVAGNDYVARALTNQVIPAGAQTYSFDVTVNGDTAIEPHENFFVSVSNVSGASVTKGQGTGTILNDDSPTLSINDVSANEGNAGTTTFTFTVNTPVAAGSGGITFDIATADGTATAASGDYVARALTGQTIPAGQSSYTFDVTVNGDTLAEPNETFFVNITNVSGATVNDSQGQGTIVNDDTPNLVISQVYPGGGLSNATYTNDFIELYNRGTATVDFSITPYSAQFLSTTASTWVKTDLTTGIVSPGRYFLIRETSGGSTGAALPAPDASGTINLTSTSDGKVALILGTTLLSGNCPGDDGTQPFNPTNVTDFVGYGGTASTANHCYEGTGPSSFTLSNNTIADFRKAGGCLDTNDNANDFFTAQPNPRNSSAPIGDCKPEITINDVSVTEGNTGTVSATFTVTLSTSSTQTIKVDFATADGTATAPSDYQANSGTLTFNPGDLTRTITVLVNGDTMDEPNETFFVNLSNAVNAVILDSQGQGTINDNDAAPSISINDVTVTEGDSGTTPATFTVSLSAASGFIVTVNYVTADNTANAGSDYQATNGVVTFNPGETSKQISVLVNGDTDFEQNESFFVNLSSPTNATIADGQGAGNINNDDPLPPTPNFFINDVTVNEGDAGTSTANFTVTLNPASSQQVTVQYATANGTATAGSDYQSTSGTLTFAPGETSKPASVTINGDTLVEPDETFFVNLSNNSAGTNLGDPQGIGTIQNDDQANLVISQVYPGGGLSNATYTNDYIELFNRGTTTVDFSITPFSVQFLSTTASTWAKTDLTTGTIAPGQYFLIKETGGANGAALPAADATGSINLTSTTDGKVALISGTALLTGTCPGDDGTQPFNPTNMVDFVGYGGTAATANHCYEGSGPSSFTLSNNTIADFRKAGGCTDTNDNADDFLTSVPFPRNSSSTNNCAGGAAPTLSIDDVSVTEGNSGTTTATFTVSLSAPAQGTDVTFDIATADGTATTANSDYVTKSLTSQIIPAGETTYTFTVTVNGDTNVEPDENFLVNVTNVVGATVADGQGTGTIQNDDLPTLSISDVAAAEGDSGATTFTFHVTLSDPAPGTVTFDIATADGTATTADNDYVARSLTGQTIAQGSSSYTFDVTVNGDQNIEPNETFFVTVQNVSGATVLDGQGQGTIVNDDSPVLNINDVSHAEGNSGSTTFTFTVTSTLPAPAGGITFDIATADGTAQDHNPVSEDNDYVARSLTGQTIPAGQTTYTFDVTVNGDKLVEPDETFFVNVTNATNAGIGDGQGQATIQNDDTANLVISQLYGGGNNSGATFQNDFVELFNRGTTTVNFAVTPYSVQYASAAGTFSGSSGFFIALNSGSLAPGQYFLIKLAGGTTNGVALPAEDASNTSINMSATDGKVALVVGTNAASTTAGGCPTGVTVAELVGYGTANCAETSATGALTASKSAKRNSDGCTDTDNNLADFTTTTLTSGTPPRNSSSAINDCNAPPLLTISDVSASEGNAGTKLFTFTVNLSKAALAGGVTFDIATQDNSATAGSDYIARSLTSQTIAAGQQTYTFDVTVNGDTTVESDETFFVNVSNVTGATVSDSQGLGTIQNDDSPPATADLSLTNTVNDTTPNIGQNVTFTIKISNAGPDSASSVQVTDLLPAGLQYVSSTVTQGSYVSGTGIWTLGTVTTGTNVATLTITATVLTTGAKINNAEVTADATTDPDSTPNDGAGDDFATVTVTGAANVVINEIVTQAPSSPPANPNDFIELCNKSLTKTVDISGLVISYRTGASTTTATTFTLPGAVGSGTTTIGPNSYLIVVNGSNAYGVAADFNNAGNLDLTAASGGVKIELNGVKIDGLTYNNTSTAPAFFAAFGEGTAFQSPTTSGLQDYIRSPNGTDTDSNTADFKRNGTTASITPKASNP